MCLDLPADALGEIAGRLHDATDFVRFHAVCRPWREVPPPRHTPRFLPCLIAQSAFHDYARLHIRWPFSGKLPRTRTLTVAALTGKTLQSSDDADSGCVLAVNYSYFGGGVAKLVDPLTGEAISLPELPEILFSACARNYRRPPSGIACNDVVVFINTRMSVFSPLAGVLLRPGQADWDAVELAKMELDYCTQRLDEPTLRALTLCSSGVLRGGTRAMAELPPEPTGTHRRHVVESQGELLCLDVHGIHQKENEPASVSVAVHALEAGKDGRPQWVKRVHGRGIEHACFFLNWGQSCSGFAIDAREFAASAEVTGGCAYFVHDHPKETTKYAVYRYSFKDGTAGADPQCMPSMPWHRLRMAKPIN